MADKRYQTVADVLVSRLRQHGVRHVFGYPGGQITPLYDGLYREPAIRHVLARDEQAAGFMADGYARATSQPGVCLAVCGPGVLNAATPLATAFTDSVPVLLLSGQVPAKGCHPRSGYYHENDQLTACATFTKWRGRAEDTAAVIVGLDAAFSAMTTGRPGPVLFEVPGDVLRSDCPAAPLPPVPAHGQVAEPLAKDVDALVELILGWRRPLILVGGGAVHAAGVHGITALAQRLGAPVFNTLMGKGILPADHPLAAGLPWHRATSDLSQMEGFLSPLLAQADGLLAIGCRFSQVSTGNWTLRPPASVVQIDIDEEELGRHYPVTFGLHADAAVSTRMILARLPPRDRPVWASLSPPKPWRLPGIDLHSPLRRVLPRDAILAADITRLSYTMLAQFPIYEPHTCLHPAGFVPMGYGIPAALGAKAAFPERTVVAIVGDGCFMMCGMELATAVQERLPIVVILVNDGSLTLIKAIQQRRYGERYLGVDLVNPDFELFARAFGVRSWRVETDPEFEKALREAITLSEPALIEVRVHDGPAKLAV
jgi:acetolactate synthase-1/2/3 large subunit